MKRPFWAPNVPEFALRLVFGEMSGILLASHRMDPSKILSTGYSFEYPELQDALQAVLT
jgi:NAD dependent epimerase/dehydratase family enzyme